MYHVENRVEVLAVYLKTIGCNFFVALMSSYLLTTILTSMLTYHSKWVIILTFQRWRLKVLVVKILYYSV